MSKHHSPDLSPGCRTADDQLYFQQGYLHLASGYHQAVLWFFIFTGDPMSPVIKRNLIQSPFIIVRWGPYSMFIIVRWGPYRTVLITEFHCSRLRIPEDRHVYFERFMTLSAASNVDADIIGQ